MPGTNTRYALFLFLFIGWTMLIHPAQAQQVGNKYAAYFDQAYEKYPTIPQGLLEAVAYSNTRMNHVQPVGSCRDIPTYYGVMGLVKDGKGYFQNSLERVAELSGYSEQEIIQSPRICILAYAAAYAATQKNKRMTTRSVSAHEPILAELSEIPQDNSDHNEFAMDQQFYSVLMEMQTPHTNTRHRTREVFNFKEIFGEENYRVLSAKRLTVTTRGIQTDNGDNFRSTNASCTANNDVTDYPGAIWKPAHTNNYGSRGDKQIKYITIHTIQGSYASAISWFRNSRARVSTHYVIRASDGQVTQMVCETEKAFHVKTDNAEAVGIEHEGFIDDGASWYTNEMYESSASLVRDICKRNNIDPLKCFGGPPTNGLRTLGNLCYRIKGHQHFRGNNHVDPGPFWDWDRFYRLVNPAPTPTRFTARKGEIYDSGKKTGNYGDQERSTWLIQPTNASSIVLKFKMLDLEGTPDKPYDYLDIYDGPDINGRYLGRFTGNQAPGELIASSGSVFMEFRSDCQVNKKGWEIEYNSTRRDAACGMPEGLLASTITPFSAQLSWSEVSSADHYYVSINRNLGNKTGSFRVRENQLSLTGLSSSGEYKWQIQAICGRDTSAVAGSRFEAANILTSPNKTFTVTANKGRFRDSGGSLGPYNNMESYVYRIIPSNGGRVELNFSSFETEEDEDFLHIYDGTDTTSRKLGTWSGTNKPPKITSTGNGLTIHFQSDPRVMAPGWSATWTTVGGGAIVVDPPPDPNDNNGGGDPIDTDPTDSGSLPDFDGEDGSFAGQIQYPNGTPTSAPVLQNSYSASFDMKFNDKDFSGRGLLNRFYSIAQSSSEGYYANGNSGYFFADFQQGLNSKVWKSAKGNWIVEDGHLKQTQRSQSNSNLYASLKQNSSDVYLYHWKAKMEGSSDNRRHGIHFFASAGTGSNRGDSYFIWVRDANSGDYVEIYKTINNQFDRKVRKQIPIQTGRVYDFKTIYNPQKGRIEVYVNDKFTVSWVDPVPIKNGSFISLRTGNSETTFDDIHVFKKRGNSVRVQVGAGANSDLQRNGPFAAFSLVVGRVNGKITWSRIGHSTSKVDLGGGGQDDPPIVDESGSLPQVQSSDFSYDLQRPSGAKAFYLASDFNGNRWTANDQLGFFYDSFEGTRINGNWTTASGTWKFKNGLIEQSDANEGNGNIYADLKQNRNQAYVYHWRSKMLNSDDNVRFGLHFFASDGKKENRGNSYFIWFRNFQAKPDKVELYRVDNDVFKEKAAELISLNSNTWYDCKLLFNAINGEIRVYLNNQEVLFWRDSAPHSSGKHISLRTGNSATQFQELRVYTLSESDKPTITVGSGSKMFRTKSQGQSPAGRIYHLFLDKQGKWSAVKEQTFRIE